MGEFISADFLKFFIPLAGAVVAWFLNERRRRALEEYIRREERYKELLKSLSGFYTHSDDATIRNQFIEEYKKCWLYCSDEVVRAANNVIHATKADAGISNEERLRIVGAFVLAIRQDLRSRRLLGRTALTASDYVHVAPGGPVEPPAAIPAAANASTVALSKTGS